MTLQEAVGNGVFITGVSRSYTTSLPAGGDYAANVNVNTINGVMNLQNAISNNLLSPCPSGQHWDVPSQGCVANCVSNMGQSCGGTSCVYAGTIQCDGSCTGYSFVARGTACADDWHACSGGGACLGWSGTGCDPSLRGWGGGDVCPWGSSHQDNNWYCNIPAGYQGRWDDGSWHAWGGWAYCMQLQCPSIGGCTGDGYHWQIKPA
jgi:hypothetical protein